MHAQGEGGGRVGKSYHCTLVEEGRRIITMEERMREVAVAEEKRTTMEWMGGNEGGKIGEEPISKDHPPRWSPTSG